MNDILSVLATLERREIITTNPDEAEKCCGLDRDEDGFCQHREGHPIFVSLRKCDS